MTAEVHRFVGPGVDDKPGEASDRPMPIADSPFDALKAAMATPLPKEIFALSPLKRPDVEVHLRSNVTLDELGEWRKGAKDTTQPGGYNLVRLVCILLANASVDIVVRGQSTGMTLGDPKIGQMFPDAIDEVEAVRAFFGNEDLWLTSRVLPELNNTWAGGEQDGSLLRPTTPD